MSKTLDCTIEDFTSKAYIELLLAFLDAGYSTIGYTGYGDHNTQCPKLILRHDIDYSLSYAKEMALIESQLGIQSTFFIFSKPSFYNIFDLSSRQIINEIHEMNHHIGLHIDMGLQEYAEKEIKHEIDLISNLFPFLRKDIISFHKPKGVKTWRHLRFKQFNHTYEEQYWGNMTYISDSTGEWRWGHPLNSWAFFCRKSIQLLTHPIWWIANGKTPTEKLDVFLRHWKRVDRNTSQRKIAFSGSHNIFGNC